MSLSDESPEGSIACAIADAHRFARDGRPCFGLLVLQQALALAEREQRAGQAWATAALARVEAEIANYRFDLPTRGAVAPASALGHHLKRGKRQSDDELGTRAVTCTGSFHGAAVQFHQALHQGEPNSQAAAQSCPSSSARVGGMRQLPAASRFPAAARGVRSVFITVSPKGTIRAWGLVPTGGGEAFWGGGLPPL